MDTREIIAVIFVFVFFALFFVYTLFIYKAADKLFKELDILEERANNAKSVDEIVLIYSDLYAVSQKSFHKRIGQRVQVVFTILKIKTAQFTQQQNS